MINRGHASIIPSRIRSATGENQPHANQHQRQLFEHSCKKTKCPYIHTYGFFCLMLYTRKPCIGSTVYNSFDHHNILVEVVCPVYMLQMKKLKHRKVQMMAYIMLITYGTPILPIFSWFFTNIFNHENAQIFLNSLKWLCYLLIPFFPRKFIISNWY